MKKARFSEEQIIGALKQMASGRAAADVARELGVSKHTIYGWNQKYGAVYSDDAKRLKYLEQENRRLKMAVAHLTLDREVLKAVIQRNGWSSQAVAKTWLSPWRSST
jgi:putative transposase